MPRSIRSIAQLTVLLFILSTFHVKYFLAFDVYPWNNQDRFDRANEILDQLRSSLSIEFTGESIANSFQLSTAMYMKNLEGFDFQVRKNAPSHSYGQNNDISRYLELHDSEVLSSRLKGLCAMLQGDYWNYEWCHRRDVYQFHMEQRGTKFVKSPNWSLGTYKNSVVVRERVNGNNDKARIIKLVDYYDGGQACEETKSHRRTEVHIQCCEGTQYYQLLSENKQHQQPPTTTNSNNKNIDNTPKAAFATIREPATCSYQAIICVPFMCLTPDELDSSSDPNIVKTTNKVKKSNHSNKDELVRVMKSINKTCLYKQEEWWTYEICFNKGARQARFNIEQSVSTEGAIIQKQVLVNQYILGTPPLDIYNNQSILHSRILSAEGVAVYSHTAEDNHHSHSSTPQTMNINGLLQEVGMLSPLFATAKKAPNHLSLEFIDGTPCDLYQTNRSTTVDLYCGKSNALVQILEDRTCHYRMRVELISLCALPDFKPVKDAVTLVDISPVAGDSDGSQTVVDAVTDQQHQQRTSVQEFKHMPVTAQQEILSREKKSQQQQQQQHNKVYQQKAEENSDNYDDNNTVADGSVQEISVDEYEAMQQRQRQEQQEQHEITKESDEDPDDTMKTFVQSTIIGEELTETEKQQLQELIKVVDENLSDFLKEQDFSEEDIEGVEIQFKVIDSAANDVNIDTDTANDEDEDNSNDNQDDNEEILFSNHGEL